MGDSERETPHNGKEGKLLLVPHVRCEVGSYLPPDGRATCPEVSEDRLCPLGGMEGELAWTDGPLGVTCRRAS